MRRSPAVWIIAATVVVAILEIGFHWLLGRGRLPGAPGVYLMEARGGKHSSAGAVDILLPAGVLGFVNGWTGFPTSLISFVSAVTSVCGSAAFFTPAPSASWLGSAIG
jgi:hypothetical protein